ncbi:MAG: 50S ribosomal protein L29 [Planctomycetota bacterium]|jgi:large subunit ribosomal protein L29
MTPNEVRKLDDEEIVIEVRRLRRELFDLRSQAVTEKITDTSRFGKLKKDIARLLTEQSSRASKQAAV